MERPNYFLIARDLRRGADWLEAYPDRWNQGDYAEHGVVELGDGEEMDVMCFCAIGAATIGSLLPVMKHELDVDMDSEVRRYVRNVWQLDDGMTEEQGAPKDLADLAFFNDSEAHSVDEVILRMRDVARRLELVAVKGAQ